MLPRTTSFLLRRLLAAVPRRVCSSSASSAAAAAAPPPTSSKEEEAGGGGEPSSEEQPPRCHIPRDKVFPFVLSNVLLGAVVCAGIEMEKDTRKDTYYFNPQVAAKDVVFTGAMGALWMLGTSMLGVLVHPALWAGLTMCSTWPLVENALATIVVAPLAARIYRARLEPKKKD